MSLTYRELKSCWIRGLRNGNIRRLNRLQRALYRACLEYTKRVGRIVNVFLMSQLKLLMARLTTTFKLQVLKAGLESVHRILLSSVSEWAPEVITWVREESYIFYLGTLQWV